MTNREMAMKFIDCFCSVEIEELSKLLAPDLVFTGTFFNYNSAAEYLAALRSDPPEIAAGEIMDISENADSVAVFWQYKKASGEHKMAQLFTFRKQKINKILLIFDGRPFIEQA